MSTPFTDFSRAHQTAIADAYRKLFTHPLASLLSLATIIVALTIPGLFLTIQNNLKHTENPFHKNLNINLFIKIDTPQSEIDKLATKLNKDAQVMSVNTITQNQALTQFREAMNFTDTLDDLKKNPLPAVIEVTPQLKINSIESLKNFGDKLKKLPLVDQVIIDQQWTEKISKVYKLVTILTSLLGILFACLLGLVMANTLRLEIIRRQEEIEVIKLVGGTDGYIVLPFFYYAIFLCMAGSAGALLIIKISMHQLYPLFQGIMPEYAAPNSLILGQSVWLIPVISILLGCISAWLAVKSGLKHIENNL